MPLLSLINSRHRFLGWRLQATRLNTDCLTMPETAWDANGLIGLPSYYIECEFTIRTNLTEVNDRQIFGNVSFTSQPNRLGISLQTGSNLRIFHGSSGITLNNFQNTYLGQKIVFRVDFTDNLSTGMDFSLKINGVQISNGLVNYMTSGSSPYAWVNAIGVNNVSDAPRAGSFSDVDYHYLDFNGKKWDINDDNGFECLRSDGQIMTGQTSNAGSLTYWNANVWQKN